MGKVLAPNELVEIRAVNGIDENVIGKMAFYSDFCGNHDHNYGRRHCQGRGHDKKLVFTYGLEPNIWKALLGCGSLYRTGSLL